MTQLPNCPECTSIYVYENGEFLSCPECGHEWNPKMTSENAICDAYGTLLCDGDDVTIIKDLKIKGSSQVIKVGTKIKNIHLVGGDHDIDCKITGIGATSIKSQFVKKIS